MVILAPVDGEVVPDNAVDVGYKLVNVYDELIVMQVIPRSTSRRYGREVPKIPKERCYPRSRLRGRDRTKRRQRRKPAHERRGRRTEC